MKLIYLTSKKFPSAKADPFYVKSMAGAFNELLGQDFLFLVRGNVPDELKRINTMSAPLPRRFRVVLYFFYMPILFILHGWSKKKLFSCLMILIFCPYLFFGARRLDSNIPFVLIGISSLVIGETSMWRSIVTISQPHPKGLSAS